MMRVVIFLFLLSACAGNGAVRTDKAVNFTWLEGCWMTDDGSIKEVWSAPEFPYQFGYALTYDETGKTVFFETMRLELEPELKFLAYPRGEGPTAFAGTSGSVNEVTFTNLDNDYPQIITYTRTADRLIATIALANGDNLKTFEYSQCGLHRMDD